MVKENIFTSKGVSESKNEEPMTVGSSEETTASLQFIADSCELTVACDPEHYSASRLAHAIEDCDAHLLQLKVGGHDRESGQLLVELRAGLRNADSAVRSLERYGYRVTAVRGAGSEPVADTFAERVNEAIKRFGL